MLEDLGGKLISRIWNVIHSTRDMCYNKKYDNCIILLILYFLIC